MVFFTRIILFYIFTTGSGIITHKSLVNKDQSHSKKIDECQRCKVLTDSFKKWLDETSRGKHEGGDAAWEEAKLKSYARSEMRLVEIQEQLCSELKRHQDECYALSEEAETLLEQWWFHEHQSSLDLFTWLCIESLQYCCPTNHYGESCTPCPHNINNKICNGNGKCNGDGTRKGDGKCICKKGFTGPGCDECAANFYNVSEGCKPCHRACDGCYGDGEESCKKCATGWSMDSGICVDDNECLDLSICNSNEYCINKVGSYDCKYCDKTCQTCEGPGASSCASCFPNHVLWVGECMSIELYRQLLINTVIRIASYTSLLILAIFIFRKTKFLSFIILIVSMVIVYFEDSSKSNLFKIISTLMQKQIQ